MPTIAQALYRAREYLKSHQIDTAEWDARYILMDIFNYTLTDLIVKSNQNIPKKNYIKYFDLIYKRAEDYPLAYLLGHTQFWDIDLKITPDVLIPRPETECLIELALKNLASIQSPHILELGTGSGCISISLAKALPNSNIIATDISEKALKLAQENKILNKINNIKFIYSNWFNNISSSKYQLFDCIVSNPPYIPDNDPHMKTNISHEPNIALTPGKSGLEAIEIICKNSPNYLNPNKGILILEHGYDQKESVQSCLKQNGFKHIETFLDYNQNPRVSMGVLNN